MHSTWSERCGCPESGAESAPCGAVDCQGIASGRVRFRPPGSTDEHQAGAPAIAPSNTSVPGKKAREIEIKVARRLRDHAGDPRYRELSERLESLRERHQQGVLLSVEFLKELLNLARDLVEAENETPAVEDENRGKAALTELFEEVRNDSTPIMVERVVNDIDEIVRIVRFDGWQHTHAGEREVKKALRKTLFKYKLHQDQELFDRAYGYIRTYY